MKYLKKSICSVICFVLLITLLCGSGVFREMNVMAANQNMGRSVTDTLTVKVGYWGMSESDYVEKATYHWTELDDQFGGALQSHQQAYSFFRESDDGGYQTIIDSVRGFYIRDLLKYAGINLNDIEGISFYTQDQSVGYFTNFSYEELFGVTRYFFNDLSFYVQQTLDANGKPTGEYSIDPAVWNQAVEVEPMLALEDGWLSYEPGNEHTAPVYEGLSTGNRFRLLFGQTAPDESRTNQTAKYTHSLYIALKNTSSGNTSTTEFSNNDIFADVQQSDYFFNAVKWALQNLITTGTSLTTFSPDDNCTRAQIVTFLWRAKGSPEPVNTNNPFTDVKDDAYYYKAVLWAAEQGVTTGTTSTTFSPDMTVTRGQTVTLLWRAEGSPSARADNPFGDVQIGQYFTNAVLWAVKNQITTGKTENSFAPLDSCTRGQIVTFLYRAKDAKKSESIGFASANIGDYVTFGHYEQDNNMENGKELIEWKVLDKKDGRVLLLSKYGLDAKSYYNTYTDVNWETCAIRNWLNSDFLNTAFSSSEKAAIPTVTLSNPDNPNYRTEGGNDTNDRVFLLSLEEMQQYYNLSDTWTDYDELNHEVMGIPWSLGGSRDVIASSTVYAVAQGVNASSVCHDAEGKGTCGWWLRSPGSLSSYAAVVGNSGDVDAVGLYVNNDGLAVRPALWVNLSS